MTALTLHHDLPDYFHRLAGRGDFAALPPAFESGGVAVFDRPPFDLDLDLDFVRAIELGRTDELVVKKAKNKFILPQLTRATFGTHFLAYMFANDYDKALCFQAEVRRASASIDAFVRAAFPDYALRPVDAGNTWRLTPTEAEEMHFDSYGHSEEDVVSLRVFVNLDNRPRLWATSYRVDEALPRYRERVARRAALIATEKPPRDLYGLHPNIVNAELNALMPWGKAPRHYALFAPLAVWVCDSQLVSHEIVYGRKLLAYTYHVEPASLRDPSRSFLARSRRALASARP